MGNLISTSTVLAAGVTGGASPFCLRQTYRQHSWRHISEGGFDQSRYDVAAISFADANAFVATHHYAGKTGGILQNYGLYQGEALVGVAQLTNGGFKTVLTNAFPHLEAYTESAELGRFVLTEDVPANAESWFLTEAFRLAAARGFRGIVSHSDPVARYNAEGVLTMPGHVGTIYQATNATYTGLATGRSAWHLPNGRIFNEQAMGKIRQQKEGHEYAEAQLLAFGAPARKRRESPRDWMYRSFEAIGCTRETHPGNHRYLFAIGDRRQRRAVSFGFSGQAYPKKVAA